MIRTMINGFCMALADSVPGVSGGTIALILGFYDKFIGSINQVFYGKKEEKKEGLIYLIKLLLGWAVGMILAVLVLTKFFETNIYAVSSLFLGFIFPSIFIIAKEEYACIQKKWQYTPFVILGIAIVAALTYMNSKVQVVDVDLTHFSVPTALYLFLAGAVAITAMFLPGISGSTVLLIFGVYLPVISGVKELLHLHFGVLPMIIVFGVGVICGALVSVKGIQKSLEKYRGQMVMLILGMLIGSLYAIVSGPVTVDKANAILNKDNFSIVFFLIGLALIVLLQVVKTKLEKKTMLKLSLLRIALALSTVTGARPLCRCATSLRTAGSHPLQERQSGKTKTGAPDGCACSFILPSKKRKTTGNCLWFCIQKFGGLESF